MKLVDFHLPPGPIPLVMDTFQSRMAYQDGLEVRIVAQKDGALGCARVHLASALVLEATRPRRFTDLVERILLHAADKALDMWLLDHETQQGWPPRDCLHTGEP